MYSSASLRVRSLALLMAVLLWVIGSGFAIADGAPLDSVGAIRAAAYSLRQLDSDYAGPTIMVRRDSDNTTSDIGFTASGDLDSAALSAFCGMNTCFVTTWYDQSGNEKNATQTDPNMQPRIVSSGELEMSGGHPTLYFFGGQSLSANWGLGYTSYAHSAVYNRESDTFASLYHQGPGWNSGWIHAIDDYGIFRIGFNGESFTAPTGPGSAGGDGIGNANALARGIVGVYTMNAPVGSIALYRNNALQVSATRTWLAPIVNNVRIGSWDGWETRYAYFHLSEMIFYSSALSDIERSTFTTDEKAYYGLDVTAPVVTLVGSGTQTIAHGSVFSDSGATWSDAVDGTGAISVANSGSVNTALTGSYVLTYIKVDAAGNTGSTTRIVVVADQTVPVVTLVGSGTITLANGAVYTESGATWSDAVDGTGAIAAASSGSVNTTIAGTYTLTYRKIDAAGNTGSTIRTVTVLAPVVSSGNSGGGGTYSAPVKIVAPSTTQSGSVVFSPIATSSNPEITQDRFDKKVADLKKSKVLTTTTTLKKGTQIIVYRVLPNGKQVKVATVRVTNGKITYITKIPGKYVMIRK